MESPRAISQDFKIQLVKALASYEKLRGDRSGRKYVVIKRSDTDGYTTISKANWLVLKIRAFLHLLGINCLYHSALQSDKNILTRAIISILNDQNTTQVEKNSVIQAAACFLGRVKKSLDTNLKEELKTTLQNSAARITPSNSFTSEADYSKLLDTLNFGTHDWKGPLATFLSTQGTFIQTQNGQFSRSEIAEFNRLVKEFLRTTVGEHLVDFLEINPNEMLNIDKIRPIYFKIGRSNLKEVKGYNEIKAYLASSGYNAKTLTDGQYEEFLQHLVTKAQTKAFILPKSQGSDICQAFFQRELREFNEKCAAETE